MVDVAASPTTVAPSRAGQGARAWRFVRRNPTMVIGLVILSVMLLAALVAPWIAGDPYSMKPVQRFKPPSDTLWFGTDNLGRDVYARTIYGARVSLAVGLIVAMVAVSIGLVIGLLAGFFRPVEAVVMRLMDGLMAIPAILLAIALVSLFKGSVLIVIIAIVIPEVPRVARLVRSVVLTTREQPYVEAAVASGSRVRRILWRHILPSTFPPLIVQATYICASAILIEAGLSFLGAGTPPEIPTWGNMIASSRSYLARAPWTVFCPGLALALVVLSVNLVGDGLRDRLDPRIARRM
jgi:peptide/nickel transport system permease protein